MTDKQKSNKKLEQQFETGKGTYFGQCSIKPSQKENGSWLIKCKKRYDNVSKIKSKDKED